jgi:hypothetical protein
LCGVERLAQAKLNAMSNSTSNEKAAAALKAFLTRLFALMAADLERRAEELRAQQKKAAP